MPKTKTFRVVNGRFHFKCTECQAKRMLAVAPGVRQRTFRCHKCKETTRCNLNRRLILREQQRGKILVTTTDGREIDALLYDISFNGVGFDVTIADVKKVAVGKPVTLRCPWNPRLLGNGRYIVKSVVGQRIGAKSESSRF